MRDIDKEIADQAGYIAGLEKSVKSATADLRQQLKDAKKRLGELLDERKSGQMSLPIA